MFDLFGFIKSYFKLIIFSILITAALTIFAYQKLAIVRLEGQVQSLQEKIGVCESQKSEQDIKAQIQKMNLKLLAEYCKEIKSLDLRDGEIDPKELQELLQKK